MRFVTLDSKNKVVGIRFGPAIVPGEIQSDEGELGQIMLPDGTFITPEPEQINQTPTLEEQVASLKEDNLILMDALATVFEEILFLQEQLGGTP